MAMAKAMVRRVKHVDTKQLAFFDEDGDDISKLVSITHERSSPWHSSCAFTYSHAILGDIDIGMYTAGCISIFEGYSFKEIDLDKEG